MEQRHTRRPITDKILYRVESDFNKNNWVQCSGDLLIIDNAVFQAWKAVIIIENVPTR